jgi:1,4-dihydroxy-2-naphthoate octaprenyltransferase
MGKNLLSFFVYSNLFITGCALVMVDQTCYFLLQTEPNPGFLFFVFFSTICSYSFHWALSTQSVNPSPRNEWVNQYRYLYWIFFFIGLAGAVIFFLYLLPWWPGLLVSVIMTFLYSAPKIPHPLFRSLRRVALGKTIFLALVWMNVTTVLPILISGMEWRSEFLLFILSRFFLIYAICILFDYRDRADDKAAGVRSLITYLNEKGIRNLFVFSLLVFAISTLLLYRYDYPVYSIAVLLIPGIITACLYNYARTNFSDIFYYLVLDGLMALSAMIMLLLRIFGL